MSDRITPPSAAHTIRDGSVLSAKNPWMRVYQQLTALGLSAPAPSETLLFESLRILLWLCSERTPPPQAVGAGPRGSVAFRWQQNGSWFELEVTSVGRAKWRARTPTGDDPSGPLNDQSVELLRSIIPMTRR
jgi:hypothetical protein